MSVDPFASAGQLARFASLNGDIDIGLLKSPACRRCGKEPSHAALPLRART